MKTAKDLVATLSEEVKNQKEEREHAETAAADAVIDYMINNKTACLKCTQEELLQITGVSQYAFDAPSMFDVMDKLRDAGFSVETTLSYKKTGFLKLKTGSFYSFEISLPKEEVEKLR